MRRLAWFFVLPMKPLPPLALLVRAPIGAFVIASPPPCTSILNSINRSIHNRVLNHSLPVVIMVLGKNFAICVINGPNVIFRFTYTRRNGFATPKKRNYWNNTSITEI